MSEQLHITIWNTAGEVVVDSLEEVQTATQDEINEMVAMIENGTPAYLAALLVKGN